jgi:cytochrome c-type biogenesis protein CcmH/NrfG
VNDLTIGLLSAMLATNQPQAASNLVLQNTGVPVATVSSNDPAEQELQKLMIDDDAASDEVDKWIRDNDALAAKGAGESKEELNKRIRARFDIVRKGYEDFLLQHTGSAHGYMAYGSFLNDIGDEDEAKAQYENARQLDPKNPAVWNNLANYYGEHGPATNAFEYYAKAIRLEPAEPVYYQNLATTVYLFRRDAEQFYGINEQQVFDKALALYRKAIQLDPNDFPLATDYAQSYYGIKPLRTNDALVAWTNALQIARDDNEREGVLIHLARIKIAAGYFAGAKAQLDAVSNAVFADIKNRLERNLAERENPPTNKPPGNVSNRVVSVTNIVAVIPTNIVFATTNEVDVSTDFMVAPPALRRQ